MKIVYVEWGAFGSEDVRNAFIAEKHDLVLFLFSAVYEKRGHDEETEKRLQTLLHKETPDVVFSLNYFPVISRVCQQEDIRYISWTYDCPCYLLYSTTILAPCNIVYVFDKALYLEFHCAGISTVHYMPLAADTRRLDRIQAERMGDLEGGDSSIYDISFVGSLYIEKYDYFSKIEPHLSDYAKGYLDALISAQLKIQGYNFVQELLAPVIEELYQACPVDPEPDGMESREYFYEQYVVNRRITAIERIDLLEACAQYRPLDLFTKAKELTMPNIRNHGEVDYYKEMPLVFKQSRINLNISLRGIKSGIPLRAYDIMGAGGFLLSNFQADFLDDFVPGEDLVYYESKEDLLQKVVYYLDHEEERKAIAKNGHDKVAARHTYRHRVREMLDL